MGHAFEPPELLLAELAELLAPPMPDELLDDAPPNPPVPPPIPPIPLVELELPTVSAPPPLLDELVDPCDVVELVLVSDPQPAIHAAKRMDAVPSV